MDEHAKLIIKYGSDATDKMIEKLDNFKGSSGKKYKSDYRTILGWVAEWWQEKGSKLVSSTPQVQPGKYAGVAQKGEDV